MLVILSLPAPSENIWYLAYGSNLSSSKFVKDRGIVPLDTAVVSVPGFTLVLDSAGVPYQEPSFASIRPIDSNALPKEEGLLGTAYLVTPKQYADIIASEGGGIAYREIAVEVDVVEKQISENGKGNCARKIDVRTLVTVLQRLPGPRPSLRYMNLITNGAAEADFPAYYQQYLSSIPWYKPPTRGFRRVGAALFLTIWVPIMTLMERITKRAVSHDERGAAPGIIIWLVRAVVITMWWYHDHIHAPFWGRGDGLDQATVQSPETDDMREKYIDNV